MKIDFSRLDALRPTAAVPEGFEPVPEAETPFDSGYEAMYRAAWDFHLETDDRLRAAAGEAREEIWLRAAAAMAGETVRGGIKNMRNMHQNPKSIDIANVFLIELFKERDEADGRGARRGGGFA